MTFGFFDTKGGWGQHLFFAEKTIMITQPIKICLVVPYINPVNHAPGIHNLDIRSYRLVMGKTLKIFSVTLRPSAYIISYVAMSSGSPTQILPIKPPGVQTGHTPGVKGSLRFIMGKTLSNDQSNNSVFSLAYNEI